MRRVLFLAAVVLTACAPAPSRSTSSGSSASSAGGPGGAPAGCASCAGACVDTGSDPRHCGACGHACAPHTLCDHGACAIPVCLVQGPLCPNDHVCCGDACCPPWQMCCNAPDASAPICTPIDAGACPASCAVCP